MLFFLLHYFIVHFLTDVMSSNLHILNSSKKTHIRFPVYTACTLFLLFVYFNICSYLWENSLLKIDSSLGMKPPSFSTVGLLRCFATFRFFGGDLSRRPSSFLQFSSKTILSPSCKRLFSATAIIASSEWLAILRIRSIGYHRM